MASQLLTEADNNFAKKCYQVAETQYTELIHQYGTSCKDPTTKQYVSHAFNNRGQIKYLRVDFDEAIEDYTQALKLDSTFPVVFYNRGLIHYRLGRYTESIADFNEALRLKPDFADCIEALKTAKLEQNQKGDCDW